MKTYGIINLGLLTDPLNGKAFTISVKKIFNPSRLPSIFVDVSTAFFDLVSALL